jgi:hypothetical protein
MGYQCCTVELQGRRFLTAEERVAELKEYQEWLQQEAKGVQEAIERIGKQQ